MSASCDKNFFFHRPLLREKINFLCFEKCRNFDFFPTLQIKELFLLKISICGFWVCCGCSKPFFSKFSKSLEILKHVSYLERFDTRSTRKDIWPCILTQVAQNASKIAKFRFVKEFIKVCKGIP